MPLLWKIALNALPGAVATTAEADTGPVRVGAAFVSLSSLGGVGRALSSAVGFYRRVGRAVSTSLAWTAPVGAAVLARAALLAHDPVGRSFRSVAVFGPAAEVVVNSCSATVDGELLGVIGLTISGDEGQYCWTLSATLATAGDWRACTPGAELVVTVNGFSWGFLVDAPGRSSRFGALAYTVSARSHTSRMDGEYADTVSKTWAASARSIAQEMCDANGISLDWRLPDWTLSEFSVDGEDRPGGDQGPGRVSGVPHQHHAGRQDPDRSARLPGPGARLLAGNPHDGAVRPGRHRHGGVLPGFPGRATTVSGSWTRNPTPGWSSFCRTWRPAG